MSHVSLRHKPRCSRTCTFAAICVNGTATSVAVREAEFRVRFPFGSVTLRDRSDASSENRTGSDRPCRSQSHFPMPLEVEITGWSPFEPGDADNASLPVAALEYRFTNPTDKPIEAVFSWNAKNFMGLPGDPQAVKSTPGGFILWNGPGKDKPFEEGAFSATVDDPAVKVNCAWFRGGWWDPLTMAWKEIADGACVERPPITRRRRVARRIAVRPV